MEMLRAIFFFAVVPLVACSSAQSDWQRSSVTDTVTAYQSFLKKHPNTTESVVARNRIHALQDEQAWARAQQSDTVAALQNYLQEQPAGMHVAEAKDLLAASERSSLWAAAVAADTPQALEGFLQKYPQGPHTRQARAKLAQLTGYRVQLASYRSQRQAERTRERLQGKYGDVLGSVVVVSDAGGNVLVRSAPMGESEANNACARLRKARLSCEVIRDANS